MSATTLPAEAIPVAIIGAGPVGLALALDLGRRGVRCVVVERMRSHAPLPKMNHVNVRSMELCRRWGVADSVRAAGWPRDHAMDVAYITSLAGYEVTRFPFPSHAERPDVAETPEPSQRCPQLWFDPLLERALAECESVEVWRETELVSFEDQGDRVSIILDRPSEAAGDSNRVQIEALFLIGADGAGSLVRQLAGIERQSWGPAPMQVAISLRAPGLSELHDTAPAAFLFVLDGEGPRGVLTPTDGAGLWRFNWNLRPHESPDDFDADAAIRTLAGLDFEYEILQVMPWQIRFTLAERYGVGRVFLAGDAARTLSPTGGLGMNTGLADAADLGWKLAAVIEGWGGADLLASYDAERRAVGRRINEESLRNLIRVASIPRLPGISDDGETGTALREQAASVLQEGDFRLEFANEGAVLGARYEDSPIVSGDDAEPPGYDPNHYEPTSYPGCRAPHAWRSDGSSMLDLFGPGFTLLRLGAGAPDTRVLESAAASRGVPLRVEAVEEEHIAALYERALVLVRPDGIVAWRGNGMPTDAAALIDQVRGASPHTSR